jgi:hypothetical protein
MTDELGAQVLGLITHMDTKLTAHMADEGKELASMKEDLHKWRIAAEKRHNEAIAASDKRHAALIQSLDSWTAKMDMSSAFLHVDGKPDLIGHKDDHLTRKQFADEIDDLKRNTRKIVVGAGTVSALSGLFYLLWEALLRGPK